MQQPFYRVTSDNAPIAAGEETRNDINSDENSVSSPTIHGALDTAGSETIHLIKTKSNEPAKQHALATPDFWMIAFIMSMRKISFCGRLIVQ
jgi:hypothetical protein